ncbi:MAG: hypothetical protein ABJB39_09885 [Chloroflexota bacterium]
MIPVDLLAVVFFVSGALLIGIWIDAAQNSFLRAHARRPTAGSFTGDEVVRLAMRPWRLLRAGALTSLLGATGTPQRDPGLERLRQRYLSRRGIGLAVIAASWVVWLGTRLV